MQRADIRFESKGELLSGWFYKPDVHTDARPCIVMAHGLGGVKAGRLDAYAERFCSEGWQVLVFDYRFFGDSTGSPRQLINPKYQIEDWHAALAYVRQRTDVDNQALFLWGTSYSGGHVFVTTAQDGKVRGTISQCPMLDAKAAAKMLSDYAGAGYMLRLVWHGLRDALRAAFGLSPHYVPLAAEPGQVAAMSSHDALSGYKPLMVDGFENKVAARLMFTGANYRPINYAKQIHTPVLVQICDRDTVASPAAAHEAGIAVKATIQHFPIGHFDIYWGEYFEQAISRQIAFIRQQLANGDRT